MRPAARPAAAALILLLSWTCVAAHLDETSAARIVVKSVRLTDNGDNDGFADDHETVSLFVTLRNVSDTPRTGVVVALATSVPTVDCLITPVVSFGSLAARETREAAVPLVFRVANVVRSLPDTDITARFEVLIWGDDFDVLVAPQQVTLDLDLQVSGGATPSTFTEGFDSGAEFGSFTSMSLDVGKASVPLSEGLRCQYHNPVLLPCQTCGNTYCYVGFPIAANNAFDWHRHGLATPDGGRAYSGNNSLHWGMHPGAVQSDTTRLQQLDALRTTNPINLGWNGVTSELSFKHQVGLTDCGYVNCPPPEAVDRGVVQVQLADSAGDGVGAWRKVYPYENLYDSQAFDGYFNCTFDPTDDGNTENDFFDPTDPNHRLGSSSTCFPEFSFAREGEIAWDSLTIDPGDVGRATDGPALEGIRGPGAWIESKFSLDRWRGRRIRLRFLVTTIEVQNAVSMQDALGWNPTSADDGWYIDDIRVTNTLQTAATVAVDTANRTGLPACGPECSTVTAALAVTPGTTPGSGEPVSLDASASSADACPGGTLLYRFWVDEDDNGVVSDPLDVLLRGWTADPVLLDAPDYTTRYVVEVQCASRTTCGNRATALVTVPCPDPPLPFPHVLRFDSRYALSWGSAARLDLLRGNLLALRASGGAFQGTVAACLANDVLETYHVDYEDPAPGAAFYYIAREVGASPLCARSWGTGVPQELPGAGGHRDADLALDPNTCP
jgi:hypothetical protein